MREQKMPTSAIPTSDNQHLAGSPSAGKHERYVFSIDLSKSGKHVGITCRDEEGRLVVVRFKDYGAVHEWNMRSWTAGFPQDCLQENDVIIAVNGLQGFEPSLNEMQSSEDLFLVVERQLQNQRGNCCLWDPCQ